AVWEDSLPHPRSVWWAARAAAFAWRQVHGSADNIPSPQPAPNPQVHATALLCYVDAGYRHQTKEATVGAVLLSQNGAFVAAFNARLPHCFSPLMAESLACKEALSWLKDREVSSVHIYTDCSTLKNLLVTTTSSPFSYVGFSIDTSRAIMSSFIDCSISLISRTANRGAHVLAALAFSQDTSLYWDAIPPDAISELI
ncbi:reverse transcriptase-like protein, partial [Escherichia coli]|uniref:reverse transcriptase-like protein n=1 Tax=Escherichia coli TaxID=562 RepID=UPI0032DA894E